MNFKLLIKNGNEAFAAQDYLLALNLYLEAENKYKIKFLKFNIDSCRKKIVNIEARNRKNFNSKARIKGVSVIVPSFKGRETIGRCINSLISQSLEHKLIEIIIILNGDLDGSEEIIRQISEKQKNISIITVKEVVPGVGNARNQGVKLSSREYITFIDDDDYVSVDYLRDLYDLAGINSIVVTRIYDDRYGIVTSSIINKQLSDFELMEKIKYNDISSILTLNACKIVHADMLDGILYSNDLKSGEDVVYWIKVIVKNSPDLIIVPTKSNCIYFRSLRENSISRKMESYDFNVTQRLCVIAELEGELEIIKFSEIKEFIMSKVRAQLGFCISYLSKNRNKHHSFVKDIKSLNLYKYIIKYVNSKLANDLVISYCFPPYVDTAGVVAAKRIWKSAYPVDVISNQMDKIRSKEDSLLLIAQDYIGDSLILNSPAAFSNWNAIKDFADKSLLAITKQELIKGVYKSVYSRAMWPGSHFAAAFYKSKRKEVKWIAEFSDPLLLNIDGESRKDIINIESLRAAGILDYILSKNLEVPTDSRLFYWCEYLPYLMADELVFTNEHQLKYMLNNFPNQEIIPKIAHKLRIIPQPTLSEDFYRIVECDYYLNPEKINIAYFGAFYSKRGLHEVLQGFLSLSRSEQSKFEFHIFTEQVDQIKLIDEYISLKDFIRLNKYIPYLQFLNLCVKMDCLFVNDTLTVGFKEINPYLPSKLSDYLGSGVPIWAACEKSSSMDKIMQQSSTGYCSYVGDQGSYLKVFNIILKLAFALSV